jgi:hypothetical protein
MVARHRFRQKPSKESLFYQPIGRRQHPKISVEQPCVSRWLVSQAFDLGSARSLEAEKLLQRAALVLSVEQVSHDEARALDRELRGVLGDTDPFWIRWRYVGEKQGWLA